MVLVDPGSADTGELNPVDKPDTPTRPQAEAEALFRRYGPSVARFAKRLGATDPEGIANLAVFDAIRAKPNLNSDTERSLRSYIYRSARGHTVAELRRRRPEHLSQLSAVDAVEADAVDRVNAALLVEELLEGLPSNQREVIRQLYFDDADPALVADQLGTSRSNVYQLRRRAILAMRRALLAAAVIALLVWAIAGQTSTSQVVDTQPVDEPTPTTETTSSVSIEQPTRSTVTAATEPTGPEPSVSPTLSPSMNAAPVVTAPTSTQSTPNDSPTTTSPTNTPPSSAVVPTTAPAPAAAVESHLTFSEAQLDVGLAGDTPKAGWRAMTGAAGESVTVDGVTFTMFGAGIAARSTNLSLDVNGDFAYVDGATASIGVRISRLPEGTYQIESWHHDRLLLERPTIQIEFGATGGATEVLGSHTFTTAAAAYSITSDGNSTYELIFRSGTETSQTVRFNGLRLTKR